MWGYTETLCTIFIIFIQLKLSRIKTYFLNKKKRVIIQAWEIEERGSVVYQPGSMECLLPPCRAGPALKTQGFRQ